MKILLVNCVYGIGSTGKILKDLYNGLSALGHSVFIAYGRGKTYQDSHIIRLANPFILLLQSFASKISGRSYECSPFSTYKLKRLVKKLNPDVVNLHCANANTINLAATIEFLKKAGIPTVITSHSEFYHTGGCGYALSCDKWLSGCDECPQFHTPDSNLPKSFFFDCTRREWNLLSAAYTGFERLCLTGVSSWLTQRMSKSPFYKNNMIFPVYNGLDTDIFKYREPSLRRAELNLSDNKVIVHVTPNFYSPIKGGKYVLELADKFLTKHPDYRFIIIGYNGDTTDCCENIIPIAHTQNQQELAEYYSLADVCLLTSERETFSMVTAESLCCGTPIVGFKAGGPESIAISEYSEFCDFGDTDALEVLITRFAETVFNKSEISKQASAIFSKERMTTNYMDVYCKLINNK